MVYSNRIRHFSQWDDNCLKFDRADGIYHPFDELAIKIRSIPATWHVAIKEEGVVTRYLTMAVGLRIVKTVWSAKLLGSLFRRTKALFCCRAVYFAWHTADSPNHAGMSMRTATGRTVRLIVFLQAALPAVKLSATGNLFHRIHSHKIGITMACFNRRQFLQTSAVASAACLQHPDRAVGFESSNSRPKVAAIGTGSRLSLIHI